MGWRAVESFHSSKQAIARWHGRGQPDVFRIQGFIIRVLKFDQRSHETSRQVKVGDVRHQTGVVLHWMLPMTYVWGMAVEAVWGWAKVLVLASTPGRMFWPHAWWREPLILMVVGRRTWHLSGKFSLSVVKAVGGVGRPVIVVSGGKVVLHEARRKASETVWRWGLVERRWLLVWRERPSEMGRSLHAWRKRGLPLAPWRLVRLVPPWWLLVI